MALTLRYGSYAFDEGATQVSFMIDTQVNARGVPFSQVKQARVMGYISGSSTSDISAKCEALEAALATPYQDLGLYDGSTLLHVALANSGSLTGTVPTGPNYPDGKGAELATYRRFEFTIRAEYPLTSGQVIQEYQETVSVQGTGGPRFVLKPALVGLPQKQIVQARTPVRATQSGRAVGYRDYPAFPNPLWPNDEHVEQRSLVRESPKPRGLGYQDYPIHWSYSFESPVALNGATALLQNILAVIGSLSG